MKAIVSVFYIYFCFSVLSLFPADLSEVKRLKVDMPVPCIQVRPKIHIYAPEKLTTLLSRHVVQHIQDDELSIEELSHFDSYPDSVQNIIQTALPIPDFETSSPFYSEYKLGSLPRGTNVRMNDNGMISYCSRNGISTIHITGEKCKRWNSFPPAHAKSPIIVAGNTLLYISQKMAIALNDDQETGYTVKDFCGIYALDMEKSSAGISRLIVDISEYEKPHLLDMVQDTIIFKSKTEPDYFTTSIFNMSVDEKPSNYEGVYLKRVSGASKYIGIHTFDKFYFVHKDTKNVHSFERGRGHLSDKDDRLYLLNGQSGLDVYDLAAETTIKTVKFDDPVAWVATDSYGDSFHVLCTQKNLEKFLFLYSADDSYEELHTAYRYEIEDAADEASESTDNEAVEEEVGGSDAESFVYEENSEYIGIYNLMYAFLEHNNKHVLMVNDTSYRINELSLLNRLVFTKAVHQYKKNGVVETDVLSYMEKSDSDYLQEIAQQLQPNK